MSIRRQTWVKTDKSGSNQGQIGQIRRNIPNIHMFRIKILSRIQIKDYLRSNQVNKRSNFGQNRQIRVKYSQVVEIYPIYICFVSKLCQEFKFKIFEDKSGHQKVKIVSKPSS